MNRLVHDIVVSALLGMALHVAPTWSAPIDEFRVSDLEQKIRNLETASREQARQIAELQQQVHGNRPTTTAKGGAIGTTHITEQRWLSLANWQKIKPGMSELQVVELLGAPTQLRVSDDRSSRTLHYAMEIGTSGFLSGKVILVAGHVTVIEIPSLH